MLIFVGIMHVSKYSARFRKRFVLALSKVKELSSHEQKEREERKKSTLE